MSSSMLQVCITYSTGDLICDVISCYIWSWDTVKINVYDQIVIENLSSETGNMVIK